MLLPPPLTAAWAIIDIDVSKFRAIGAVDSSASFLLSETSSPDDFVRFVVSGTSISVQVRKTAPQELDIWLRFRVKVSKDPVQQPECVLLGMAFNELVFDKGRVGQLEFPEILIGEIDKGDGTRVREMQVKDAHLPDRMGVNYSYSIFIQNTDTGEVGIIDPPLDTEVFD